MRFIKKLLMLLSICLLLFLLVGCDNNRTNTFNKKTELGGPAILKVLYQDKSIYAKRGSYSWTYDNNNGQTSIHADGSVPPILVKNSTPLTVPPKSSLILSFSDKPTNFTINIWQNNKPINQAIIDDKLVVPESKGLVIYEVIANWNQGTACYAFSVNVD